MNEILLFVTSMPPLLVYVVAGSIAGALGTSAGFIAQKYFGVAKGWRFVPVVVFAVISLQLSQWLFEDAIPMQSVSRLKQIAYSASSSRIIPKRNRIYRGIQEIFVWIERAS